MEAKNHEANLAHFTGTDGYHRIQPLARGVIGTDGVNYVAEEMGAHWLISDIMIVVSMKFKHLPFQVWTFKKDADGIGRLTMREDTGEKVRYRQKYEWTDFPLDEIKFYVVHGSLSPEGPLMNIMMLPGEY